MTATETLPASTATGTDEICHVRCCDEDYLVALCGLDLTDHEYRPDARITHLECAIAERRKACPLYGKCYQR